MAVLLGCAIPAAIAQEQSAIDAWLQREWEASQHVPDFSANYISFHTEDFSTLSPDELHRLRSEVEGHPDHPRRSEYELASKRATTGPTITRLAVFAQGDGKWRFNTDLDGGGFTDVALTPKSAWQLAPASLKLFNLSEIASDPEQNIRSQERVFRPTLNRLLYGGIGYQGEDFKLEKVQATGDHWSATFSRPRELPPERQFRVQLTGRWDPAAGRGFVESYRVIESGFNKSSIGWSERFEGWKLEPASGLWIATHVDSFSPAQVLTRRVVFDGMKPLPEGGFDAVVATPAVDREDVVRGAVKFKSIIDFAKRTLDTRTDLTAPLARTEIGAAVSETHWLAMAGWILLGILSVALGIVTWNRRRFRSSVHG